MWMMKNKYIVITAICLFIIIAGVCYSCSYKRNQGQEILLSSVDNQEESLKSEVKTDNELHTGDRKEPGLERYDDIEDDLEEPMIYVHLCGAVVNPDVYKVKTGTRLVELIDIAGGLIPEAADDYVNQALTTEDGQRIYIPTKDELKSLGVTDYVAGDNNGQAIDNANNRVNINTADKTELMSLPGIGEAKANSIIEYRKKNGSFKTVADLMNISGIKEGLFTQIEDLVTIK
jgi:competence protein ComEA